MGGLSREYGTCYLYRAGVFGDPGDVERLLELGTQSLREGHLSDALLHYHAAIGMLMLAESVVSGLWSD